MKVHILAVSLFISLTRSAPTSDEDNLVINEAFFPDDLTVQQFDHDIVKIVVPINQLNFNDDEDNQSSSNENSDAGTTLFFVLADIKDNGDKEYKGLYILKNKKVKKLLDNGVDVAAVNFANTTKVFFAATDGLYFYNYELMEAEKQGFVNESIIGVATENGTDIIYILNENHELFKLIDGVKMTRVADVPYVEQFVLDYSNNLYFYGKDKVPYVINKDGIKKFEGLPASRNYIQLLRPPFVIDDGVPIVIDDQSFFIYANGTVELTEVKVVVKPTAYAMEATLIQYYAHNKRIYEYNMLLLVISELLGELTEFFSVWRGHISRIASLSKHDFGVH